MILLFFLLLATQVITYTPRHLFLVKTVTAPGLCPPCCLDPIVSDSTITCMAVP